MDGAYWRAGGGSDIPYATDLSWEQAVSFSNGPPPNGDGTTPAVVGDFADLVREAATAVLNFHDAESQASFVEWYIYERNLTDNDADDDNNPTDVASALADLKAQVQATFDGAVDAYSVDELAALLHLTHH